MLEIRPELDDHKVRSQNNAAIGVLNGFVCMSNYRKHNFKPGWLLLFPIRKPTNHRPNWAQSKQNVAHSSPNKTKGANSLKLCIEFLGLPMVVDVFWVPGRNGIGIYCWSLGKIIRASRAALMLVLKA